MKIAEQIKELLISLDPYVKVSIEDRPDGSTWVIGPYPSFIIMLNVPASDMGVQGDRTNGYIVSVNGDAPNVLYFMQKVFELVPGLQHFGPYCEDAENMTIVGGPEAYEMKEEFLLKTATQIYSRRKAEANETPKVLVPENKIIITGNQ